MPRTQTFSAKAAASIRRMGLYAEEYPTTEVHAADDVVRLAVTQDADGGFTVSVRSGRDRHNATRHRTWRAALADVRWRIRVTEDDRSSA